MDPASITIQLNSTDLRRYSNFVWGFKRFKTLFLLLAAAGLFAFAFYLKNTGNNHPARSHHAAPSHDPFDLIVSIGPILIFIVVFIFAYRRSFRLKNLEKSNPGAVIPNTYTVLDEGLFCRNDRGESLYYWKTVTRFVETDEYLFLMLSERLGHIFPKRCFSNIEAATFANQIRLQLEKEAPAALAAK